MFRRATGMSKHSTSLNVILPCPDLAFSRCGTSSLVVAPLSKPCNRYKLTEIYSNAGKYAAGISMADMVLPVLDVVDGGRGIFTPPSQQDGIRRVLNLRRGAQRRLDSQYQSLQAHFCISRPAARGRSHREGPAPCLGFGYSRSSCHLGILQKVATPAGAG